MEHKITNQSTISQTQKVICLHTLPANLMYSAQMWVKTDFMLDSLSSIPVGTATFIFTIIAGLLLGHTQLQQNKRGFLPTSKAGGVWG
jgi:hypothetical protein